MVLFFAHFLRKNGNKVTLLIRDPTTLNMFNKLNRYQAECLQGDYGNVIDPQYPNELCPPHLRISKLIVTLKSHEFTSRPNIIIALNSHHAYKKAKFGSQFKLIHSGFGEIDLGIVPRRFDEIKEKELNINSQSLEINNEDLDEIFITK
ncbi:unnamed protein product [Rhizophagus irregularis]|nr:unnamed protein product [Rhizophagus irregularis]